jgi:hypothetical protein
VSKPFPTDRHRLKSLHDEIVKHLADLRSLGRAPQGDEPPKSWPDLCYGLVLARPYLDIPTGLDNLHSWWKKEPWCKLTGSEITRELIRQTQELLEKVEERLEASATAKPTTSTDSQTTPEIPDYVTLTQAAGAFKKTKGALVKHKKTLPPPITKVEPGSGHADLWEWSTLRIWGSKTYGIPLEKIPKIHPHTAALRRVKTGRNRYKAAPR